MQFDIKTGFVFSRGQVRGWGQKRGSKFSLAKLNHKMTKIVSLSFKKYMLAIF
jgi:hypothetical protein